MHRSRSETMEDSTRSNACSFGYADVVRLLLETGANPNTRDNWNYTEAASKGKVDVCIALLEHGADPNIRNSENKIPLDLADPCTRPVLTGKYRKDELLEAARFGSEERLAVMGHEGLKQVGVSAYGFRHKILKGIATLRATTHRARANSEPGHSSGGFTSRRQGVSYRRRRNASDDVGIMVTLAVISIDTTSLG
ncbi:poly [ADP-ribose] polymerase tankyrase-like, partial [Armigeres subalbatus]|uniref:poly [ADP-ribose] polymerase tankyrase-like n=1 Tax=Armigeres subalbatus TaxID=124917 RepID=UPI002ED385CA